MLHPWNSYVDICHLRAREQVQPHGHSVGLTASHKVDSHWVLLADSDSLTTTSCDSIPGTSKCSTYHWPMLWMQISQQIRCLFSYMFHMSISKNWFHRSNWLSAQLMKVRLEKHQLCILMYCQKPNVSAGCFFTASHCSMQVFFVYHSEILSATECCHSLFDIFTQEPSQAW